MGGKVEVEGPGGGRYLYAKIENPHPQCGMMQEINKRHRIMFDLTFIVQFIAHDKTTSRKNQDIIEDNADFYYTCKGICNFMIN